MPEVRLTLPRHGLSDEEAYTDQPPTTCRIGTNATFIDEPTGRARLSKRSGLSKFLSTELSSGDKVQALATIVDAGSTVTFVPVTPDALPNVSATNMSLDWSTSTPGNGPCKNIWADRLGLVYAQDGDATIQVLNRDGNIVGSIPVGIDTKGTTEITRIQTDDFGNVFVIDGPKFQWDTSTSIPTVDVSTSAEIKATGGSTKVRMYQPTGDDTGSNYTLVWEDSHEDRYIRDMVVVGGTLYTLVSDSSSSNSSDFGMYVRKYALGAGLPLFAAEGRVNESSVIPVLQQSYWGQIAADEGGNVFVTFSAAGAPSDLNLAAGANPPTHANSYLVILDSALEPTGGIAGDVDEFGAGMVYDYENRALYTVGPGWSSPATGEGIVAKYSAEQLKESVPTEEWSTTIDNNRVDPTVRPAVDRVGNLYVPLSLPASTTRGFISFEPIGGEFLLGYIPDESSTADQTYWSIALDPLSDVPVGNQNYLDGVKQFDLTEWGGTATATVTADADEGPFFSGNASSVEDDDGASLEVIEHLANSGQGGIANPVVSAWIKRPTGQTQTESELLFADNTAIATWSVKVDWSGTAPTVSSAVTGAASSATVGITGPDNGYYRVYVNAEEIPASSVIAVQVRPASASNAATGLVYAWGVKVEDSSTGKPSRLTRLYGSDVVYVGTDGFPHEDSGASDSELFTQARAVRLIAAEASVGSVRERVNIGVANGDLFTFDATGRIPVPSGQHSVDPNDGLAPGATYVDTADAFGYVVLVDGARTLLYDIKTSQLVPFKSETAGKAPQNAQLAATWNGRLVLARFADQPDDWAMSAYGDIFDWDVNKAIRSPTAAVNATLAVQAGVTPDIITALIPVTDDRMLFGCDHSIFELLGNPADGGQIDTVSDTVGIAFGKAWATDPEGNVFFVSSKGELFMRAAAGGPPQAVTERTIVRRLETIDLSTHRYHLEWNYRRRGLHIFVLPYGDGGAVVQHWFFERKHAGIWEYQFGSTDVQPTAILTFDGDTAADRTLLIGCEDGFVRKWDEDADDDDGNAIDWDVLLGPYKVDADQEVKLSHIRAKLDPAYQGCHFDVYAEVEPHELTEPVFSGVLPAGASDNIRFRARGSYVYLRLRNAQNNTRCSVEEIYLGMVTGSRRRRRVTA